MGGGKGGKKQTVGYRYHVGMHMVVCHGPVDSIRAISVDDRDVISGSSSQPSNGFPVYFTFLNLILLRLKQLSYDSYLPAIGGISSNTSTYINKPELFGGESREGGIAGALDIMLGAPDQGRNEYLQAQLGDDIPAFRGVVSAVLNKMYIGTTPYLKPWAFTVQRIHTREDGIDQWYDEKSEILVETEDGWNETFDAGYDSRWSTNVPASYIVTGEALRNDANGEETLSYFRRPFDGDRIYSLDTKFRMISRNGGDTFKIKVEGATYNRLFTFIPRREDVYTPHIITSFGEEIEIYDTPLLTSFDYRFIAYFRGNTLEYSLYRGSTLIASGSETCYTGGASWINFQLDGDSVYTSPPSVSSHYYINVTAANKYSSMNPAHIIRECLTNPDWGMGYPDADIDDDSFTAAADTLYDESFGLSLQWTREAEIESFIQSILDHISGTLFIHRVTGLFTLKLIRADYSESDLIVLDELSIRNIDNAQRPGFGELTNSVTVQYTNANTGEQNTVTVQDHALVQAEGTVISSTIQYPGITGHELAARAALRDLKSLSSSLLSCDIYASRLADQLNIGDAFICDWPDLGIDNLVMRVQAMSLGDGRENTIKVTAVEDVFIHPDLAAVSVSEDLWTDPTNVAATESPLVIAQEMPYYEAVVSQGESSANDALSANNDLGFLSVSAVQPEGGVNAVMMVNAVGSSGDYEDEGILEFAPSCKLSSAVTKSETVISVEDFEDIEHVNTGSYAQIDDELVRIDSVSTTSITVGRGILDTVPAEHSADARVVFIEDWQFSDGIEYTAGENVDVKLLTITAMDVLGDANTRQAVMNSRAYRPYPPGDFTVGGSYFPETIGGSDPLVLAWAHRDRLQQTSGEFYDFTETDIGPEDGTTYTINFYDENDTLFNTVTDVATNSYTYTLEDEIADANLFVGAGATSDFPDVVAQVGPLAYWKFDESSGTTAADSSGNGYDATYYAAPTLDQPSLLNSGAGKSITLDGSAQYVAVTDSDFNGLDAVTLIGIVQPASLASRQRLITKGSDVGADRSKYSWDLRIEQTSGAPRINVSNGTDNEALTHSTDSVDASVPRLVIAGYDASTLLVSVDGNTETASRSYSGYNSETGEVSMFRERDGGSGADYYGGGADDFVIVDRLLTQAEIEALAEAFLEGPITSSDSLLRQNGRVRVTLESVRDGYSSYQAQEHTVYRTGYGFNYGMFYGGA